MSVAGRRFLHLSVIYLLLSPLHRCALSQTAADLSPRPPMGWSSWNHYACEITDRIVRQQADAMVSSGMKARGYTYVNIDGCWAGKRDLSGRIHPNAKFPDMLSLSRYIHGKGLKVGIYSSPGEKDCQGDEGSFGHELLDAQTYAEWEMDYVKYDLCDLEGKGDQQAAYKRMGEAIKKTGRPMIYSLCQYGEEAVWRWGATAGGNLWRTTDDIRDSYYIMAQFGFGQNGLERFAGPGHWNDPDMLEIGNGGMTNDEYRTQISLWSILAAPLIAGNDLTRMDRDTLALLTNPAILAIDQDSLGIQGHRLNQVGEQEVWIKSLSDGSVAIGLFNRGWGAMPISIRFADAGVPRPSFIEEVWSGKVRSGVEEETITVPRHGVVVLRAYGDKPDAKP